MMKRFAIWLAVIAIAPLPMAVLVYVLSQLFGFIVNNPPLGLILAVIALGASAYGYALYRATRNSEQ